MVLFWSNPGQPKAEEVPLMLMAINNRWKLTLDPWAQCIDGRILIEIGKSKIIPRRRVQFMHHA